MSKYDKKRSDKAHDMKLQKRRFEVEGRDQNYRDKVYAMQKKNAMGFFGALLLQGQSGKTYKLKLQNPRTSTKTIENWLKIANAECGTEAVLVRYDKGQLIRLENSIMVTL